tara:strand:- start:814 stop:1479 length:666 start_codon:yes stop_codon:yes gene_type:complete
LTAFAQSKKTLNYKHACAVIANQFEGEITTEALLNYPFIELRPNNGTIISFSVGINYNGWISVTKISGSNLIPSVIETLRNKDVKYISFTEVKATINGDTLLLNPLVFDIGKTKVTDQVADFCYSVFLDQPNSTICKKSNPQNINALRGYYNGKYLKLRSMTVTYYPEGKSISKQISGNSNYFNQVVKLCKRHSTILLSNIVFEGANKEIKGTPILLSVTN